MGNLTERTAGNRARQKSPFVPLFPDSLLRIAINFFTIRECLRCNTDPEARLFFPHSNFRGGYWSTLCSTTEILWTCSEYQTKLKI